MENDNMSKNYLNNYRYEFFDGYAEHIISPLIKKGSIFLFYPTGEENPVDTNTMNNQSIIARFVPYNSLREFGFDEDNNYEYDDNIKEIWEDYEECKKRLDPPYQSNPQFIEIYGTVKQMTGITFGNFRDTLNNLPIDIHFLTYDNGRLFLKDINGFIIKEQETQYWNPEKITLLYLILTQNAKRSR